jgi:hypothetical protein
MNEIRIKEVKGGLPDEQRRRSSWNSNHCTRRNWYRWEELEQPTGMEGQHSTLDEVKQRPTMLKAVLWQQSRLTLQDSFV